jgi:hypothetical protein
MVCLSSPVSSGEGDFTLVRSREAILPARQGAIRLKRVARFWLSVLGVVCLNKNQGKNYADLNDG